MKKIFIKLFIATFPFLCIMALYVWKDPFKVLYHYDNYFPQNYHLDIPVNRDVVSTEQLLTNIKKRVPEAFVFGSSRSRVYRVAYWSKYIGTTNIYHYDAYKENLLGVERKINFLHERGIVMKDALIILDSQLLSGTANMKAFMFAKSPKITKDLGVSFQLSCFTAFLDKSFLFEYIKYLVTHKTQTEMFGDKLPFFEAVQVYDPVSNEERFEQFDSAIEFANRDSLYQENLKHAHEFAFYERPADLRYSSPVIFEAQKNMLLHMKQILDEDKTKYKIVISPLFDQKKLAASDLTVLKTIFGADNVYDFSGQNIFTASPANYYESSHYRPNVGKAIIDSIYRTN